MVTTFPQLRHLIRSQSSSVTSHIIYNSNHQNLLPLSLSSFLPPTPPLSSSFPFTLRSSSSASSHFSSSMSIKTSSTNNETAADPPPPSIKTVRVVVKGRVQGVFYRNWTIENAKSLGLKGWVRNRRDGSVEALFSGNPDTVHDMEERCRRGPPDALVTSLNVFPSDDDPGQTFQRFPTI